MDKVLNMTFTSSLTKLCEVNSSFDTGVLRVCYVGDNQNGSNISEEAINESLKTIYNCPVVCNYNRESDTLGGHDIEVAKDANGDLRLVNLTDPIGVIPESARVWFEDYEEEDGTIHKYLYVEVLLWKRQEAYHKIKSDGVSKHSMEITVKDGYVEDGIYYITNFEFTAFTLIGVDPCFEGSALEMFSKKDFKQQLSEMMKDLRESFQKVETSNEDDNTTTKEYSMEGGEKVLDQKMELVAKYGINIEDLDFSVEDFTVEELEAKFAEMSNTATEEASAEEGSTKIVEQEFALTGQVLEEICRVLASVTTETKWGTENRYWYVDCNFEKKEVYCHDTEDWLLYGFTYEVNGDAVTIDFNSKKRMKWAITEFEDGEQKVPFEEAFAQMKNANERFAETEAKYAEASDTITAMETELNELRQFKADIEASNKQAERDAVFNKFEDLAGIEAFEALKNNCSDYDADALEEKCFAIRGRNTVVAKFAADTKTPKITIENADADDALDEPYGGVFMKYSVNKEN